MTIFLDLDGVCCDFTTAAVKACGWTVEDAHKVWPVNQLWVHEGIGISTNQFWKHVDACGIDFWANLEPYPWFEELYAELCKIQPVVIATSPSLSHYAAAGKVLWLQKHLGRSFRDYIITPVKHHLSRHDAFLIDDSMEGEAAFNRGDGNAILFPARWNRLHEMDAMMAPADRVRYIVQQVRGCLEPESE